MEKREHLIQFGKKIRKIRKNLNLSQENFGYKTDLHRTYIGSIERGEQNISIETLLKIAKALNVEPSELLPKLEELD